MTDDALTLPAIRILDANLNRANEGLRTLEDLARFVLDDQTLCSSYKGVRHELVHAIVSLCGTRRYLARDVGGDVGTQVSTQTEGQRDSLVSIAMAASARVEQSLRCIEECSKLASADTAGRVEVFRYRVYQLNAKLILWLQRDRDFLHQANLYVLVDCTLPLAEFVERCAQISEAGVDLIQLRDKAADASRLVDYAAALNQTLDAFRTRLIVNDRSDIAACSEVHGVHLGQHDLTVYAARKLLRATQWIGLSTHDSNQLTAALQLDIDYIGCGPTFPSSTKNFSSFAGLNYLQHVASQNINCPAFAIGGINLENLRMVLNTGIKRVAVAQAIWNADKPASQAARFKDILAG